MALFDSEDVRKLKSLPKEIALQALKSCVLELFIQVGEAGEDGDARKYLEWLQDSVEEGKKSELMETVEESSSLLRQHAQTLDLIRQSIKEYMLPPSSCNSASSAVVQAVDDQDKGRSPDVIHHVNEFLDTTFVDDVGGGVLRVCPNTALPSHSCESCGSFSTVPRPLISHSASVESLIHLFKFQLPDLSDFKLLDIGSGLGSVLYGAYFFSKAAHVTGIELNEGFCHIVSKIINKYNLHDRLRIIRGDIMDHADAFKTHDVVVFNNVLEFFTSIDLQVRIWEFLMDNIKPGTLFVTCPDLHSLLRPLNLDSCIGEWVEPSDSNVDNSILLGLPETDELFCIYKVIRIGHEALRNKQQ